ncbi:MAG: flagellar basal body rod protein FlgB [Rhodoferax sp.]|nr:flagellar basal body rod protein FlgB [Rhodoferax sp.]
MFAQLTSGLDFQANALIVRAERQRVIASNIANADTPGYAARDVNFKDAMAAASGQRRLAPSSSALSETRKPNPAHIPIGNLDDKLYSSDSGLGYTVQSQPAMDNNSVDLDRERANSVDNSVRYETTLRFINGYSKTILSAIQGQ